MSKFVEARLVEETEICISQGIVYTTVQKDGMPYTTAMRLSDYLRHHHRARRVIEDAMLAQQGVVEDIAEH